MATEGSLRAHKAHGGNGSYLGASTAAACDEIIL